MGLRGGNLAADSLQNGIRIANVCLFPTVEDASLVVSIVEERNDFFAFEIFFHVLDLLGREFVCAGEPPRACTAHVVGVDEVTIREVAAHFFDFGESHPTLLWDDGNFHFPFPATTSILD